MLISVAVIVKNEELVIKRCLKSLNNFADEIILVDTGSDDDTLKIAQTFTNEIYHFEWINDFSAARNFAISKCKGKYILIMDADEYIDEIQANEYKKWLEKEKKSDYESYIVNIHNFSETLEIVTHQTIRLIKNNPNNKFVGKIHEQIVAPNYSHSPIEIYHTGYFSSIIDSKNKVDRNYNMLLNEIETKPHSLNYYYLAKEYIRKNDLNQAKIYLIKALGNPEVYQQMWVHYGFITLLEVLDVQNETDEMKKISSDLINEFPTQPEYYYYYGKSVLEDGDLVLAKHLFEGAIALLSESILDKSNIFENSLKALWKIYYISDETKLSFQTLKSLIILHPQKKMYVRMYINLLLLNKNDIMNDIFEMNEVDDITKNEILRFLIIHNSLDNAVLYLLKINKESLYSDVIEFSNFINHGHPMSENNVLKNKNDTIVNYYYVNKHQFKVQDSATFVELLPYMSLIDVQLDDICLNFEDYLQILLSYSMNLNGFLDNDLKIKPLDYLLVEMLTAEIEGSMSHEL